MQYTGLISVPKTSIPGWLYFGVKITQTSVFLDSFKTVWMETGTQKVYKSQCFINDQLLCGQCQPIYTEATG